MKHSLLIGLFLLFASYTKAQKGPCQSLLRIILLDSSSQQALHFADIEFHPQVQNKIDSQGHTIYILECLVNYDLHINHLDCEHKDLRVSVHSDSTLVVYLKHSEHNLLPFTFKQRSSRPDANQINQLQIQRNKGQSVGYLMEQLNGVQLIKTGQGIAKPMVNGLYGNRLILINSYSRLEGQNWGLDHAPELDPNIYQNIIIIQGAKALRFGSDAFAAVIQMLPISVFKPKGKALEGEVNVTGISNGWGQQAHVNLGSKIFQKRYMYWQISGSAKQIGNYTSSQDRLSNTAQKEAQLTAQLGYKQKHNFYEFLASNYLATNGLYTGAHVGNIADIQKAISAKRPFYTDGLKYNIDAPKQTVEHHFYQLKINQNGHKNSFEHILSHQFNHRQEFDIVRSSSAYAGPSIAYFLKTTQWQSLCYYKRIPKWPLQMGISAKHQINSYQGYYFIPGFKQNQAAAHAIFEHDVNRWHHEGSLRYDWQAFTIYTYQNQTIVIRQPQAKDWSYTYLSRYQIGPKQSLQLNIGKQWRMAAPNERYANGLHQSLASIELGDSNINKESGHFVQLKQQFQSHAFRFEAEAYWQLIKGFIQLLPSGQFYNTIRGYYPVFQYKQTDAQLFGLNTFTNWQLNKQHSISHQLYAPYGRTMQHQWLNYFPSASHKFNYGFKRNKILVEAWGKHVSQQKHYDSNTEFAPSPKAYTIYGLNVEYSLNKTKHPIHLGLSVNNLFNLNYRDYLNRLRYFIPEPGINIAFKINYNI